MVDNFHIISALVEDRPGVLFRVTSLIRRRNFNIDTITVGSTEREGISRITLTMRGDENIVEQLVKQLSKIPDIIKISELKPSESVYREMAIIKVLAQDAERRSDVLNYVSIFRGKIIDASKDSLTIEIVGNPNKINAFIEIMKSFGIIEMAKTGIVALQRGLRGKIEG
ncbi:MAG: acetolactate synthase small subunit [Candidatus Methanomethyliaceae archaeon]|nr:acetolactate synthase small subunit [Candidatus Methanomethyliaceae archaeon]MDW7970547.1 acetolactate synthase small subunit [Nitrososphaerota archaeon]